MGKHMTSGQRAEAARRYQAGYKVREIAATYGVDVSVIQRLMTRLGVPKRRQGGGYDRRSPQWPEVPEEVLDILRVALQG